MCCTTLLEMRYHHPVCIEYQTRAFHSLSWFIKLHGLYCIASIDHIECHRYHGCVSHDTIIVSIVESRKKSKYTLQHNYRFINSFHSIFASTLMVLYLQTTSPCASLSWWLLKTTKQQQNKHEYY
jgi:hypothetical protein